MLFEQDSENCLEINRAKMYVNNDARHKFLSNILYIYIYSDILVCLSPLLVFFYMKYIILDKHDI